jgi:hypothetical protein
MRRVGFEPTIPGSERAKTVHALDGSATVIGVTEIYTDELRNTIIVGNMIPQHWCIFLLGEGGI